MRIGFHSLGLNYKEKRNGEGKKKKQNNEMIHYQVD